MTTRNCPVYTDLEAANRRIAELTAEFGAAMRIIEAHRYDMEELRRLRKDNRRMLHIIEEMNERQNAAVQKG